MDALVAVRARIAAALFESTAMPARLGDITLHTHQREGAARLRRAIDEFGGALLADAPGLGKTFTALAVAAAHQRAVVVAPAALRSQWLASAAHAGVTIRFVSVETLSRRPVDDAATLLIVDEAHHVRTPGTARYRRAAALALGKRVLLISATPIHNSAHDRTALLALFLGARAAHLDAGAVARLVVRRESDDSLVPRIARARRLRLPAAPGIGRLLGSLPAPLPAADGREAAMLVRQSLAHGWSSSIAALSSAVRRARQRADALDDALASGRWPTRGELRAWHRGDDATQLAFAELVASAAATDVSQARFQLRAFVGALTKLGDRCHALEGADTAERAARLCEIMQRHPKAAVVAFSRYAATVEALWRALRATPGVVAITGSRVQSAGSGMTRRDMLDVLSGLRPAAPAMPIRLLLATDLLGEGVDLRCASVVVHLDQPWTPARAEQREGRAARLGVMHPQVTVYSLAAPAAAERLLGMSPLLQRKREAMRDGLSTPTAREQLARFVRPWLRATPARERTACVASAHDGWVAVLHRDAAERQLVAGIHGTPVSSDASVLLEALRAARGPLVATSASAVRRARREVRMWIRASQGATLAASDVGDDDGRRLLIRRLVSIAEHAPLHSRREVGERVIRLRVGLSRVHGAGASSVMHRLASMDDERLFDETERLVADQPASVGRSGWSVEALLVLVARPSLAARHG